MRTFLYGIGLGLVFAALRAPRGLELIELAGLDLRTALWTRAAALAVAASAMLAARRALALPIPIRRLTLGAIAGFGAGALLLDAWLQPASTRWLFAEAAVGAAALVALGGPRARASAAPLGVEAPRRLGAAGVALAGAGASFSFEALARWLRLFGLQRAADDAAFGLVFLALVGIGALCFRDLVRGWVARLGRMETPAVVCAGLVLASAACLASILFLSQLAARPALERYVGTFGLRLGEHATFAFDALLAARAFALPALFLGAGLAAIHHRAILCALLGGAAFGHLAWPAAWALFVERSLDPAGAESVAATAGAMLAALGACLTIAGRHGRPVPVRLTAFVPIALLFAAALGLPAPAARPLAPWQLFEPHQELALASAHGLISVESARGFSRVATVDRRRVSPLAEEEAIDERRIELAAGLLDRERAGDAPNVLLVGQMTPSRWLAFGRAGLASVDRTAPWAASMEQVESLLFDGLPRAPGEVLSPEVARGRLAAGHYALVVVPPIDAPAPVLPKLAVHPGTLVVAWLEADSGAAQSAWGPRVLCASEGFLELSIGAVAGPLGARPADRADGVFGAARAGIELAPAGSRRRRAAALEVLVRDPFLVRRDAVVDCAARLAEGAETERQRSVAEVLEATWAAQVPSMWASRLAEIEIDFAALERLRAATVAGPAPDAFLAGLWEGIAAMLVEQREIEALRSELGPVAAAHAVWPALERPLARADLEFLEPASAAERLLRLVELDPRDIDLALECAHALSQAGRHAEAAARLRAADALQPGRRDVRRALATAMVRAGESGGRALVRELLDEDPSDLELEPFLGQGPYPEVPVEFRFGAQRAGEPQDEHHDHDHAGGDAHE